MKKRALPDHVVTNDGGRTTVYLLHGIYGGKEYWRPLTSRLAGAGYRVIAWDAPGYGLSKRPDEFSFDAVAEAGARLVRATGSEHNVVFGHSMGGQVTPRLVGKVADRVRAAVITATIGYFANRTPEEQAEFVRRRTQAPAPGTDAQAALRAVIEGMFAPGASGSDVDLVRDLAMATPPETVQASVRAVQAYPEQDAVGAFGALAVPTLLVAGSEDQVGHPEGMRRVAAMIRRSEFAVVSRSGHYPWAENPGEFTPLLLDFLQRHAPA